MDSDEKLLNEIYSNSVTAINAISVLLKKVNEEKLYNCLFEQMLDYRKIANEATKMLEERSKIPDRNASFVDKTAFYFAVNVVGMGRISTKRLVKILINGSNEGIFDIAKHINACTDAGQKSRFLAYSLIDTEEKNINKMNEFL